MPRVTAEALCTKVEFEPETVADAAVLHATVARGDGPWPRVRGRPFTVFASWWDGWATPSRRMPPCTARRPSSWCGTGARTVPPADHADDVDRAGGALEGHAGSGAHVGEPRRAVRHDAWG
jgi:hypothetical protein